MVSVLFDKRRNSVLRFSRRDSVLVSLTALHAAVLVAWPIAPVIGLGVWWNSNTIAHNFIHRPFLDRRPSIDCSPPPSVFCWESRRHCGANGIWLITPKCPGGFA